MMPRIRDARFPEELDDVRELLLEYQADIGVDLCFQGFSEELATLPGSYARPAGRLLLAVEGSRIVGCVGLRPLQGSDGEMKRLYVRPHARRNAVGRLLAMSLLDEARKAGYARVVLDTLPSMTAARALYRSLGFTEIPPYCRNPNPGILYFGLVLPGAFVPGAVRYDGAMSRDFDAGRALSSHSLAVWRAALEPYLGQAGTVLDLGSGTGRFAVLIAEWFGIAVIAVEPSAAMREVAAASAKRPNVSYVGGCAERLPLRSDCAPAALLSNVYHHVADRPSCASELRRVLRPAGRLLIRGAFSGRLDGITLFDHFPEAKVVCEQFPSLEETVETFAGVGFEVETVERVAQQTCASLEEMAARTRTRADTTLALMTDEAFAARQAALEQAAARETNPTPVIDTLDLLVLRKGAA